MRFSLWWLLAAIALIALCTGALRNANLYWAGAARTTLFLVLSIGVVVAIASTGATRAFWMGFSIVGAIQFWSLGFAQGKAQRYSLADQGIEWLHPKIVREVTVEATGPGPSGRQPATQVVRLPYFDYFRVVAHCIICAMLALLGGYIGKWVYLRRDVTNERSGQ